jgi:hypothetical protein
MKSLLFQLVFKLDRKENVGNQTNLTDQSVCLMFHEAKSLMLSLFFALWSSQWLIEFPICLLSARAFSVRTNPKTHPANRGDGGTFLVGNEFFTFSRVVAIFTPLFFRKSSTGEGACRAGIDAFAAISTALRHG